MVNLVGSLTSWGPKTSKPAEPVAQPIAQSAQATRSRPKHYKQETLLSTVLDISLGLCVFSAILYGLLHLMHWLGDVLRAVGPVTH